MADTISGWEPERRSHFDEIVLGYDRVRPSYPDALFADVLAYAGAKKGQKAMEIGAGTGKATAPFLEAGYDVTAVELGENMAGFLREKYRSYPDFRVIASAFEDAPVDDAAYDLIYAASAFHWVKPDIGCPKVFRLLRSGAAFALLRYNFNFVPAEDGELCEELRAVYEKHYYHFYPSRGKPARFTRERLSEPSKLKSGYGFADLGAYGFRDTTMRFYDTEAIYSADDWITFLGTLSDHRCLPEEDQNALYAGVRDAIMRHGGQHTVAYVFQLYMGRKP